MRVFNHRGSVQLTAHLDSALKAGVVSIPSVGWASAAADGNGVNVLTNDSLADMGGGPVFYSCLVQAELAAR